MAFPIPVNESQRLAALRALNILDTTPEIAYDEIAGLAAQICGCPVGYISFVDDHRRWLKAKYGLRPDIVEAPRETAVCSTTICGTEVLVVPDMTQDRRFDRNPMVVGDPHCRFYCGMPLITDEGYALGALCVMDFEPRQLSFEQMESLRRLSRQVLTQLELRRRLIEHDQTIKELDQARIEVAAEKARAEELLNNLLPAPIAEELKKSGKVQPKYARSARFCSPISRASRCWPNEPSQQRSSVSSINISRRSTASSPVTDWRSSRRSVTLIWRLAVCSGAIAGTRLTRASRRWKCRQRSPV